MPCNRIGLILFEINGKALDRKIRVAAVSYLNTKPLIYGFAGSELMEEMELLQDYPARVAQQLMDGTVDVALVPVAVIPLINNASIISDYCIGASQPVASVCLFSDVPLEQIESIYLDYQSRTSVALLQLLLREKWAYNPVLIPAEPGFEEKITGTRAGLVIGDRAFEQLKRSAYVYDLAEQWQEWTGLPFVFAAWVANKPLPEAFQTAFNEATGKGLQHLEEIIRDANYTTYDLHRYYTQNIDYLLDEPKRNGLNLFLEKIANQPNG
jgi:chorismate dehydratase